MLQSLVLLLGIVLITTDQDLVANRQETSAPECIKSPHQRAITFCGNHVSLDRLQRLGRIQQWASTRQQQTMSSPESMFNSEGYSEIVIVNKCILL